jgi:hypothetical protein
MGVEVVWYEVGNEGKGGEEKDKGRSREGKR